MQQTKKRSRKIGLPPGSLVYIGDKHEGKTVVTVVVYNEFEFARKEVAPPEISSSNIAEGQVCWVDVIGIHQEGMVEKIGSAFKVHPLLLEDIMNTGQRPKLEIYDDYLFVVLRVLFYDEDKRTAKTEQMSIVLGGNYVVSFQERETHIFDPVLDRLKNSRGPIRKLGADYLMYSLIDIIVDNYFVILEKTGERIDDLEVQLLTSPRIDTLRSIQKLKTDMIFLRRSVWPLREVVSRLEKGESVLIRGATVVYLRDVYDHTVEAIDTIETHRDVLSGMLDIYLSSVSNRLNEVMKVLTIIATIFIPLTFIAGVYGMNFEYMPELDWYWGYPAVLSLMATVSLVMLYYFRKKKWF